MTMFIARNMLSSHLVRQIQYIVMVTIMKTKMATKICNMTVILTVRIHVLKWSEQNCFTQVTEMMGWWSLTWMSTKFCRKHLSTANFPELRKHTKLDW